MINKPTQLTPKSLDLVKETFRIVLQDDKITKKEMGYLRKLYWVVFELSEVSDETIISDLSELAGWNIKDVSK